MDNQLACPFFLSPFLWFGSLRFFVLFFLVCCPYLFESLCLRFSVFLLLHFFWFLVLFFFYCFYCFHCFFFLSFFELFVLLLCFIFFFLLLFICTCFFFICFFFLFFLCFFLFINQIAKENRQERLTGLMIDGKLSNILVFLVLLMRQEIPPIKTGKIYHTQSNLETNKQKRRKNKETWKQGRKE